MKNIKILAALFLITGAVLFASGNADAYMRKQTSTLQNTLVPANVSCEVHETKSNDGKTKTSVRVKNTSDVAAYIRINFVSYWVDAEGNVVYMTPHGDFGFNGGNSKLKDKMNGTSWINQQNSHTFYYTSPVAPDAEVEFLAGGKTITLNEQTVSEVKYTQVVDVFAEAIQANPTKAVTSSWGVTLTGTVITSVPAAQ